MTGTVFLVGAGPGDPELLTIKAARVLERADAVLYDRLVDPGVLRLVPPGCLLECVGKAPGGRGWTQPQIHQELIALAHRFHTVVRLKGGDPFVFGRGGEESWALYHAAIPVHIVPGLSSALGAPAVAGVPVTHRGVSSSVLVIEGHDPDRLEWRLLSGTQATLVFLMAVGSMATIAERLALFGKPGSTPAAILERASTERERVIKTTMAQIGQVINIHHVENPAVFVIGEAVGVLPSVDELRQHNRGEAVWYR